MPEPMVSSPPVASAGEASTPQVDNVAGASAAQVETVSDPLQTGGGRRRKKSSNSGQTPKKKNERFVIERESSRYIHRFRLNAETLLIRLAQPSSQEREHIYSWMELAIRDIHAHLISLSRDNENQLIGITLNSSKFAHGPAGLSFRAPDNFSADDLWDLVSNLSQSNDNFELDDSFEIIAMYVTLPTGGNNDNKRKISMVRRGKRSGINPFVQKSVVAINNIDDNLCLPRALVVGEMHLFLEKNDTPAIRQEWKRICLSAGSFQRLRALELTNLADVMIPEQGCGYREMQLFQNYYVNKGVAIMVYDQTTFGSGEPPIFNGREVFDNLSVEIEGTINVCYDPQQKHFHTITNLTGASGCRFYCIPCNVKYKEYDNHLCKHRCNRCLSSSRCETENVENIHCPLCNRNFYGESCYDNHVKTRPQKYNKNKQTKSICDTVKMCERCLKRYNTNVRARHECGISWCKMCQESHGYNKFCFMQPVKEKKPRKNQRVNEPDKYLYVFYDFETRQNDSFKNHPSTCVHVPILCIAQQACSDCIEEENLTIACETCGTRDHVFRENPVESFLDLYLRDNSIFKKIICIAHNASGFDAHFLLKDMVENRSNVEPTVILNGQKIIMIQHGRTKFIDSLNYFHMKLSALPKTFGLAASLKKGYFPHLFVPDDVDNSSRKPTRLDYDPGSMSENDRTDFYQWYEETIATASTYNYEQEIVDYCRSDVEILRLACLAFRKIMLDAGKVCPFSEATTIASACSLLYRKNFLRANTIGIIPAGGYRRADRQSQKAVEWLLYCELEYKRNISHAARGREIRLAEGFLVDGFLSPGAEDPSWSKGTVFEFEGCYTHGCPSCYPYARDKFLTYGRTFDEAYENTMAKINKMSECGYEVFVKWECEFDTFKRLNPQIFEQINKSPLMSTVTLDPRACFTGGRTENFVAHYKVSPNEKIKYTDICSLYPYICKRGKFPLGHPQIHVAQECATLTGGNNDNLASVEGLIKCTVLPPRNLHLPLLPVKMNGRLLFALCRSCCEEERAADCNHENEKEREFSGVWIADELRKAVQLGYRITKIDIIWQYSMTQYDGRTGGLFVEYIDKFLKIKQQASGWPADAVDEESKDRYIEDYERNEGIRLDKDKIESNAGLRSVAKICLNSFWGKFGQRSNLKQTSVVKTREAFLKLLTHPDKEVLSVLPVNDQILYVNWQLREEATVPSYNTNVVIAAYTTAQARLKLYEHLEKLDRRLLYCDTDSCIFVKRDDGMADDEYEPPLGTLLGDMTCELSCYGEGTYIDTFVSAAPKFYAYKAIVPTTGETIESCKVRGVTLNYRNSAVINFNSVLSLIDDCFEQQQQHDDDDDENDATSRELRTLRVNFNSIGRTALHDIVTRKNTKICRVVLKKRRYVSKILSLPYGYKNSI